METLDALEEPARCSFCDREESRVRKLVSGPGVRICDQCVDLAGKIVDEYRGEPAPPRFPGWETLTDEQMLDRIPRISAVVDQVEAELRLWVRELRRRGVTWARIGAALGTTRQSAWERFSGEE
ncbi:ClpX C4-type zinc finger protein [Actinocorallia populi]|uniref:ClpX C4-type zinc finger protein n=1 Tax=Actinocorallia populi TaxID=2079200 RepID=UPI001E3AB171|nr:ClpX C4-type zinc finger protein [Actinocorallia populi]